MPKAAFSSAFRSFSCFSFSSAGVSVSSCFFVYSKQISVEKSLLNGELIERDVSLAIIFTTRFSISKLHHHATRYVIYVVGC